MARAKSLTLDAQTTLGAVAAPTNNFIQPAQADSGAKFQQLANSLGQFSDRLSARAKADKAKEDHQADELIKAKAIKNDQLGLGVEDAIRNGDISSDKQELYTKYADVLHGNREAILNQEATAKELSDPNSELYTTDDIQGTLAERRTAFFESLSPNAAVGAVDEWKRTEATILESRRKLQADNLITNVRDSYSVMIRDGIQKGIGAGHSPEEIMDEFQGSVGLLSTKIHGIPNSDKNKMVFTEVTNLMQEAIDNKEFDKADRLAEVLMVRRKDSDDPSKEIPPVATGESLQALNTLKDRNTTARAKEDARLFNLAQETTIKMGAVEAAKAGKLFDVQDQTYTKADGTQAKVSRDELIDGVVENFTQQSMTIAKQRGETPEQTFARETDWYATQGVTNPHWKAVLQNGYKSFTTNSTDNLQAPPNAAQAFQLYRQLSQRAPMYVNSLMDDTGRQFYEAADISMKYLGQDESQALNHAWRAVSNPSMRGRSVPIAKIEERLKSDASLVGNNTGTLTGTTARLANTLLAAGMSEDDAVAAAAQRIRANTVVINGWSVYSNSAAMPQDFSKRATGIIDTLWSTQGKSLEDQGYEKEDLHIINSPNDPNSWFVQGVNGRVLQQFGLKELQQITKDEAAAQFEKNKASVAKRQAPKPVASGKGVPNK